MTGILLINLGSPKAPTVPAVRKFLRQFLSDPLVIDIHPLARWLLLNLFILPFRPRKSAAAYQKIWGDQGSPLIIHTEALAKTVASQLGENYAVEIGMRYGSPSIEEGLKKILSKSVDELRIFPLYPQYASSSTESSLTELFRVIEKIKLVPPLKVIPPFYDHPSFIRAWVEQGKEVINRMNPDHVLFSFHGLPERHLTKLDKTGSWCLQVRDCCEKMEIANQACYRAHCFQTAKLIAKELGLTEKQFTISFQSRLGRTPWIKPYTDILLTEFPKKGIKWLAVFCPSFVADCLETLEEIGIRGRDSFLKRGGEHLELIPSLNENPLWVEAVCQMINEAGKKK